MDEKPESKAPVGDLKSRLGLSTAKSRLSQAKEDEERRKAEEDAQRAAEEAARKQQQEARTKAEFSAVGLADEGQRRDAASIARDLAELEAMRPEPVIRRRIPVAKIVLSLIIVAFMALVGYNLGKANTGRRTKNLSISEAQHLLDYVEVDRKLFFEAVEQHRKDIAEAVEKLSKGEIAEDFRRKELYAIIDKCDDFLARFQPLKVAEMFPGAIYNPDMIPLVVNFVESVNQMFLITALMSAEREPLDALGVGEQEIKAQEILTHIVFEPTLFGEAKVPGNKASLAFPAGNPRPLPLAEGAPPETPVTWVMPMKIGKETAPKDTETSRVAEFDAWPLVRSQQEYQQQAAIGRAQGTLAGLSAAAEKVSWKALKEKLEKIAQEEPVFEF